MEPDRGKPDAHCRHMAQAPLSRASPGVCRLPRAIPVGELALYVCLTRARHHAPMPDVSFDATITIGYHHLRAAGVDPQQSSAAAVDAVRRAVARMDGANWIDVEAAGLPAELSRLDHRLSARQQHHAGYARVARAAPPGRGRG